MPSSGPLEMHDQAGNALTDVRNWPPARQVQTISGSGRHLDGVPLWAAMPTAATGRP
jgi:hypothetical protein